MLKNTSSQNLSNYRPDIDGLKGLAIIFVFVFHYAEKWLPGGFVGVDVFFVISGYLVGRSVFQNLERKKFKLSAYFAHRARRIFPSLILLLFVLLPMGWLVLLPNEYTSLGKHIGAASVFMSNWLLWREVGYFDTAAELKPLLNLWSLGMEEQFYLVFPALVFLGILLRGCIGYVLAACLLATFVASEANIADMKAWAYFHPLSRLWELLVGAVLAYAQIKGFGRRVGLNSGRWLSQLSASLGLVLLVWGGFFYTKSMVFPGAAALLPVLGAALVIAAGSEAWLGKYLLSRNILIGIGLISYPLYLWHWPLLSFVRIIDGMEPSVITKVVLALVTLVLSIGSYFLIEKPVRFGGLRKIRWIPVALWALLLIAGGAGYGVYKSQGFPERFNHQASADAGLPAVALDKGKVVLVGDSHGIMYEKSLRQLCARHGYELVAFTRGGCMPLWNIERHDPGYGSDGCPNTINKGIEYALNTPDVRKTIIVGSFVGIGNIYDISRPDTNAVKFNKKHTDAEKWTLFEQQLKATVVLFTNSGKALEFFQGIPELDFDPVACEHRPLRIASDRKTPCSVDFAKVQDKQRRYRAVFSNLGTAQLGVAFFDPVPVLCTPTTCKAESGDLILYENATHLNEAGARYVLESYSP